MAGNASTADSQAGKTVRPKQGTVVGRSLGWWATAGALALILGIGSLFILRALLRPLAVLFLGATLAATLAPPVAWLEKRMPRTLAVVLIYLLLFLIVAGLLWLTVPPLVQQAQEFATRVPDILDQVQQWFSHWQIPAQISLGDIVRSLFSNFGESALAVPTTIASAVVGLVLVIFISLYWLILAPRMEVFFLSLFPGDVTGQVWQVLSDMSSAMGGYLRGAVLDGLILGAVTYVGLLIIGIDYPLVLGVISGISEFLPVVGPIITTVIVVIVALFQSPTLALIALAFLVVLQQIENHILVPNVMQSQTTVSPLLTILMVFAGGALGGLLGATIAIPLAAALRVLVVDVIAPGLRRLSGSEEKIGSHEGENDGQ